MMGLKQHVGQSPAIIYESTKSKDIAGIRHKATMGKRQSTMRRLSISCSELAIALQLLLVKICK
jgi:hypothetical protein